MHLCFIRPFVHVYLCTYIYIVNWEKGHRVKTEAHAMAQRKLPWYPVPHHVFYCSSSVARGGMIGVREVVGELTSVDRKNSPNHLAFSRNLLQWLRRKNRRSVTEMGSVREQGAAVLADKVPGTSEQKRTRKPKQVIKLKKNGNQALSVPQMLTYHWSVPQSTKSWPV